MKRKKHQRIKYSNKEYTESELRELFVSAFTPLSDKEKKAEARRRNYRKQRAKKIVKDFGDHAEIKFLQLELAKEIKNAKKSS